MTRAELEHIIRAAGMIANVDELVVIGSQSILGQFPDAPPDLLVSVEADVFSIDHPERSDLIDSTIGEGSPFQRTWLLRKRSGTGNRSTSRGLARSWNSARQRRN